MSASSKKKLRNAEQSGKLTERQLEEQKKNKEVRMYTIGFTVVVALLVVVAIVVGGMQAYNNAGIKERKTIAYTVGDHELNSVTMSYFFSDSVNNFVNQYGAYASMFGLDTTKPLDEQYVDEEKTKTWADNFMEEAKTSAKTVYALVDEANAAGHKVTDAQQEQVDLALKNMDDFASNSNFGGLKGYLKAVYGNGATVDSYREYMETSMLADSYRVAKAESLTYEDAELREAEKDRYNEFSSFSYHHYYLPVSSFLVGGTEDEEGNKTYTDEENAAAAAAAEEAAKLLTADTIKTAEDLDKAIAALDINKDKPDAASNVYENNDYLNIPAEEKQWITDDSRKAGDMTYVASTSTTGEEGSEVVKTTGFNVILFDSRNDNTEMLPNVRHILIGFEGGVQGEMGQMVYTDEEKAAAKEKAEAVLAQYEAGEKTEDAFAALAAENSTDQGSKDNGGLYENVFRGQMVPAFNDWVFDESRKAGDTGIVETDFGYHVMYFSGEGDSSYRDLKLRQELSSADMEQWFKDLMDATVTADGDLSLIRTSMVLGQ